MELDVPVENWCHVLLVAIKYTSKHTIPKHAILTAIETLKKIIKPALDTLVDLRSMTRNPNGMKGAG